ncbi:MAG: hypothetical protein AAGE94_21410, partial [Acidobacteriota bacterium]
MELADLLVRLADAPDRPTRPPIFTDPTVEPAFWQEHFKRDDGVSAWDRLRDHAADIERETAVITPLAWERLLEREKLRRAVRFWRIDHQPDGSPRDDKERRRLHLAEHAACAADLWHWLHHHGWIETPHATTDSGRIAPLVTFPGQAALMWWLRDGIRVGRETGRTCFRHLLKSRKVTASWSSCFLVAHALLFERAFSAKIGSITGSEADDKTTYSLLGKLRFIVDRQPSYLFPGYFEGIRRDDAYRAPQYKILNQALGSRVAGETMTPNFGRSGREVVLWQDESASVPPSIQASSRAGRTSVAACEWSTSTPRGRGNQFHLDYTQADEEDRLVLRWTLDPRLDDAWFESLLIGNGGTLTQDQRAQEYACSFAGVSGLRIWEVDRSIVGYREDTPEWAEIAEEARGHWQVCGGMDFGEGPSATVYVHAILDWDNGIENAEYGRIPRVWFDREIYGHRQLPNEMAQTILGTVERTHQWSVVGDPAGKRKQIHQTSWESDLQLHGLPITCLDEQPFSQRHFIDKSIDTVGEMLRLGLIRVHEERCPVLLHSMEGWEWDVPAGLRVEQV